MTNLGEQTNGLNNAQIRRNQDRAKISSDAEMQIREITTERKSGSPKTKLERPLGNKQTFLAIWQKGECHKSTVDLGSSLKYNCK